MIDHLFHEFFGKPVILIVQGPTSASLGLDHLRALVNKYQMNVVDELSMKIPYEYVSSPKRVASEFDGTYTNDPFLKEWELKLQEAIEKLES
ncbi:hypothetical protein CANTEDRAFT_122566 [Yamadazyma tenuis ATCC 10573]|nr:uncharacterized protein CANTEDRAFT_122566 [Yamadazyma tenuis ATCC 10573]EGV64218.1 hypothetical protein CANTEDRAFT_122566 [Yamadazyma tenuis ATCC 10573]